MTPVAERVPVPPSGPTSADHRARSAPGRLQDAPVLHVTAGVLAIGLLTFAYGSHVLAGGFLYDDWVNVAARHLEASVPGALGTVNEGLGGSRPLLSALLLAPHYVLGSSTVLHLTYLLLTAVAAAGVFFLVLQRLGVPSREAAAASGLALLFPWSSSTRLWITMAPNNVAVAFGFGALLLLSRKRGSLRALGVIAHVVAVLIYEAVVLLPLLTVLQRRGPVRTRLRSSVLDATLVVGGVLATTATRADGGGLRAVAENGPGQVWQAWGLAGRSVAPFLPTAVSRAVVLGLAVAVLVLVYRGSARHGPWIEVVALGAGLTLLGYLPFTARGLGALGEGISNRANLIPAFGLVALLWGSARLLVERWPRPVRVAAVAYALVLAWSFAVMDRREASRFVEAQLTREQTLTNIELAVEPERGQLLLVFGLPGQVEEGIPVFVEDFDLEPAVRVRFDERALSAFPVFDGARIHCTPSGVLVEHLPGPFAALVSEPVQHEFGTVVLVDARDGTGGTPSRRTCDRLLADASSSPSSPPPDVS